jgi:hypothetical protein
MATAYDEVLFHTLSPLNVKDNPARVAPPPLLTRIEDDTLPGNFADASPKRKRELIELWLDTQADSNAWLQDQLAELDVRKILINFLAHDDSENGRLVANVILALGDQIERDAGFWK